MYIGVREFCPVSQALAEGEGTFTSAQSGRPIYLSDLSRQMTVVDKGVEGGKGGIAVNGEPRTSTNLALEDGGIDVRDFSRLLVRYADVEVGRCLRLKDVEEAGD